MDLLIVIDLEMYLLIMEMFYERAVLERQFILTPSHTKSNYVTRGFYLLKQIQGNNTT